jgi:hypothetical protein
MIKSVKGKNIPAVTSAMCFAIVLQSYMFMVKMFDIMKRRKKQWRERRGKGVKLWWIRFNPELKKLDYIN